jgi:hypothetical protein
MSRSTATTGPDVRRLFAASLALMPPSMLAAVLAQEPTTSLTRRVKAGHETTIGYAQRWNKKCEPQTPELVLTVPPDHGSICAREFITVAKRNVVSADQTCVGTRILGLQVIYLARSDYSGHDTVDYIIRYRNMVRSTHAEIEVRPDDERARARLGEENFAPGRAGDVIAACAPLSS